MKLILHVRARRNIYTVLKTNDILVLEPFYKPHFCAECQDLYAYSS